MRLTEKLPLLAAAIILLAACSARASLLSYTAILDGPSESPANASPGLGLATVDLDTVLNTMRVQVSFSGLTGTTTVVHIHSATLAAFSGTAGVATTTPTFVGFPVGVTSGSMDQTYDMTLSSSYNPSFVTANGGTTASAEAALFQGIADGKAYFNIHTTAFGGGEIRGFLVPEPASLGLVAVAGAMTLGRRRAR